MAKRARIGGLIKDAYTRDLVNDLATLGYKAIMYAYKEGAAGESYKEPVRDGKWRHRTRNLHDSFGSAVFVNGRLVEDSIRYVGGELSRKKDRITAQTGRESLLEYFHSNPPEARFKPITLICTAAMYYTKYLEEGTHNGHYKIQVISGARDYIERNWERFITNKDLRKVVKEGMRLPDWA